MQENYTTQFLAGEKMFAHHQVQACFVNYHRLLRTLSAVLKYRAHETAICRNPHNSSNWDYRISRQFGYKQTFCQSVVSTNKLIFLTCS